jgi:hypothetical protein
MLKDAAVGDPDPDERGTQDSRRAPQDATLEGSRQTLHERAYDRELSNSGNDQVCAVRRF